MEFKINIPDPVVNLVVDHLSHIHGTGKLVRQALGEDVHYTNTDISRAHHDAEELFDLDNDGDVDLDDASEALNSILEVAGDFVENIFSSFS